MRTGIVMLLLAAAGVCQAGEVYRCVGKGGRVSLQSEPCPADSRVDRITSYVPDPEPSPQERLRRIEQEMEQRRQVEHRRAAVARRIPARPPPSACELAKAERESVLKAVGLRRTFDLLSALDRKVYDACK
ncbi:MAG TPA: DUF4124 domain-containing protein [Lysobacter sp.]|nr:DUF4124 domain-containing protein [Lysobacter sp.]